MSTWKITFGPVWSRDTLGNVKRSSGMSFDFVSRSGGGGWWLDLVCELRASYMEVVRGKWLVYDRASVVIELWVNVCFCRQLSFYLFLVSCVILSNIN
ncbi:hypothetical protein Peur_026759 [Populus x canadensis]